MKHIIQIIGRFLLLVYFICTPCVLNAQSQTIKRKSKAKSSIENRNAHNDMYKDRIERNIDDIILGISTQQDVIGKLTKKKMKYKEYADGYVIISNGRFHYMGIEWEAVMYKFYHNKVWVIVYVTGNKKDEGRNLISFKSTLMRNCYNKYNKFFIPSQIGTYYSDSTTEILIQNNSFSNQDISLTIGDISISNLLGR